MALMCLPLRLASLALAALALIAPARAQLRPDWTSSPGGSNSTNSGWRHVVPGPDGSVTVAGSSSTSYVERYAPGGTRLWQSVGLASEEVIAGLAVAADGTAFTASTTSGSDLAVRRVNADGTPGWSIVRDGPNSGDPNREFDTVFDAAVTPDGDVVVVAQSGFGAGSQTWTIRLDGVTGAVEWERVYDYTDAASTIDRPQKIGVDCAGHVYAAGHGFLQGYVVEYMPDGTQVRAGRIGFQLPGGGAVATVLDEMNVACDGTVTVSGVSEVLGNSRKRVYIAQFAPGSGSGPTWSTLPFLQEAYISGGKITELAVDASGRSSVQVSLYNTDRTAFETWIAQVDGVGSVRWTHQVTAFGVGSDHYTLAADATTVFASVGFNEGSPISFRQAHQAFSAENGTPLGIVYFQSPGFVAVAKGAVDPAGGYVVSEGWQVRRLTTSAPAVARVQVVHASAAIAGLGPIEVYLNQPPTSTTPDATVSFRGGSTFVTVPAGQPLNVRVRPVAAPPPPLPREISFTASPLPAGRYVVSLAGIPAEIQAFYAANPGGVPRDLRLILAALGLNRPSAARGGGIPVVVTNAVTDAPAVDVVVAGTGQLLADDLPYGAAAPPTTLAPGTYRVEVRRASDQTLIEAVRFVLDGTEGTFALTATGFLNPAANRNGPALALTATDTTGTTDTGVVVTGPDETRADALALDVVNPVRGSALVRYALAEAGAVRLAAFDALGREVTVLADGPAAAGTHAARLDGLAPGVYVLRLASGTAVLSRTVTVVH